MNIDTERERNQQVIVPVYLPRQDNYDAGSYPRPTLIEILEQDTVEGSSDADDDAFEIAGPEAMDMVDEGEDEEVTIEPDHAPLAPMQEATSRNRRKFGYSDYQKKFVLEVRGVA